MYVLYVFTHSCVCILDFELLKTFMFNWSVSPPVDFRYKPAIILVLHMMFLFLQLTVSKLLFFKCPYLNETTSWEETTHMLNITTVGKDLGVIIQAFWLFNWTRHFNDSAHHSSCCFLVTDVSVHICTHVPHTVIFLLYWML